MRKLLLFLAALLVAGPALAVGQGPGECAWPNCGTIFDVRDYGTVADGVAALSCEAGEDTPMDCDTAGTGTDDAPAFDAAIAAACATGLGGDIYAPAGVYRIGAQTGTNIYTSGINVTCDNITIRGDGPGATVLLLAADNGLYGINVCSNPGANCAAADQNDNFTLLDLSVVDDDPFMHKCANGDYVTVSNPAGTFLFQEPLTFSASGATANFFWVSSEGDKLFYDNITGTPTIADTITGTLSGATIDIDIILRTDGGEETHAVALFNAHNFLVENCRFEHIGDEAVVVTQGSQDGTVQGNYFYQLPGCPSAGAAVDIQGGQGIRVLDNDCILGLSGGKVFNKCFNQAGGSSAVSDITIALNRIVEDDSGSNDHTEAQSGITGQDSTNGLSNVIVSKNTIAVLPDWTGTCDGDSSFCDEDSECAGGEGTICENMNRSCADAVFGCQSIYFRDGSGGELEDLMVKDNILDPGNIFAESDTTGGAIQVKDNIIIGDYQWGIRGNADIFTLGGNSITGHGDGCINIVTGHTDAVVDVFDNKCVGAGGAVKGSGVGLIQFSGTSVATGRVRSNELTGAANTNRHVYGINCANLDVDVTENVLDTIDSAGIDNCNHDIIGNEITNILTSSTGHGIVVDGQTGVNIIGNVVTTTDDTPILCDNCQSSKIMNNTVSGGDDPGIQVQDVGTDGTSDYNICFGNHNLDVGETIVCGDGEGVGGLGDYIGCTDEGGSPDGVNTYCGGNIIGP